MKLKVRCPAKINLTLKVFNKDEKTGFHPIESVMQSVSLYDYLTIETTKTFKIELSGNSREIEYNENNLVYKGVTEYFKASGINHDGVKIYIEKNIPVAAGLAGGSTDCAGVIYALNYIYHALDLSRIKEINSLLGSDINFCYVGAKALCKGKGDEIYPLEYEKFPLTIVKPKNLKISTKDAYHAFDNLKEKSNMPNDLEFAVKDLYNELKYLHNLGFQMSGSGPSFFIKKPEIDCNISKDDYLIFENLTSVKKGVEII